MRRAVALCRQSAGVVRKTPTREGAASWRGMGNGGWSGRHDGARQDRARHCNPDDRPRLRNRPAGVVASRNFRCDGPAERKVRTRFPSEGPRSRGLSSHPSTFPFRRFASELGPGNMGASSTLIGLKGLFGAVCLFRAITT